MHKKKHAKGLSSLLLQVWFVAASIKPLESNQALHAACRPMWH
ncbi:unnamed protein product [Arabidopsis lyrata]|nr:unnamed protein product [Arabidopsis lyrata]